MFFLLYIRILLIERQYTDTFAMVPASKPTDVIEVVHGNMQKTSIAFPTRPSSVFSSSSWCLSAQKFVYIDYITERACTVCEMTSPFGGPDLFWFISQFDVGVFPTKLRNELRFLRSCSSSFQHALRPVAV